MTIAAIALAEVRSGLATDKMVVVRAESINDIGSEQIRASERQGLIRSVHSIAGGEQVFAEVITDGLRASLSQPSAKKRVLVRQLVVDPANVVTPVVVKRIAVVHLTAWVVRLRKERCEFDRGRTEFDWIDAIIDERCRQ